MAFVNLSLQIVPVVPEEQIYPVVDAVIQFIDSMKVAYEVGPMETTMEGELEDLLKIVLGAQKICTDLGVDRVLSIVKIDYRKTGITIDEKIHKYR